MWRLDERTLVDALNKRFEHLALESETGRSGNWSVSLTGLALAINKN